MAFQNCGGPKETYDFSNSSYGDSKPEAPSQLMATGVSSVQINLTWVDNSNNEAAFVIERAAQVAGPFTSSPGAFAKVATVGANVTSYADTGVLPSQTYYYRVFALNPNGWSPPSSQATGVTSSTPTSPPSAPTGLTVVAAAATVVNLSWNDNSNNEVQFKIERSANGGGSFTQVATVPANVRTYQDFNLLAATAYVYRVRASNGAGDSPYSANTNFTTPAAGNTNSYQYISANILRPNCLSCHGGGVNAAGISFANYNSTRNTVSPGNANGSTMFNSIVAGRMPPSGALSALQIQQLRTWIDSGALDN